MRVLAVVPAQGFAWLPFVGATVDQELGLRNTFDIPAQAVTPADTLIFSPSTTFWGGELGVDLLGRSSVKVGIKAFYEASADTQTFGGAAYLKIPFEDFAPAADSGIRIAPMVDLPVKAPPPPAPTNWNWAGLYIGGHLGGALSVANFADPFGSPVYGDTVRSPGFLGGGQIGYNWQAPKSRWVFGVEADASALSSDGANTCFAVSSTAVATTCRAVPEWTGTLTGRIGYAFDPAGRTLVFAKGGLAVAHENIQMALDGGTESNGLISETIVGSSSQGVTLWGGTVGVGVEHALTPAWSVKAEYDYLGLASANITNLGSTQLTPTLTFGGPLITGVTPPGTSGISANIHEFKLGLNYKWGADPWARGWNYPVLSPVAVLEIEGGGRYFGSWGQFQKSFGNLQSAGLPILQDLSRLTYDGLETNSGEFFGRIDTPWNLFVKGYIGGGGTGNGQLTDEDYLLKFFPSLGAYSNTLSPAVTGEIRYGTIDAGYDLLRGGQYKVGAFAGYFDFNQKMNAFGCTAIAFINCTPNPVPTSGAPIITENDNWNALRIGVAAETMLTEKIGISADAAYLPWVWFNGADQHFVGNTGALAEIFNASGRGNGVQVEAALSYFLTPRWSVGLGAHYWGMWTSPTGQNVCTFGCGTTSPEYFRAQVEQLGAFVQTSYKFDWGASVATLH